MRKINFRKINIFVVMMLACALVLVGPASAYSVVYTDHYRLRCGGSVGDSSTTYWANVQSLDGNSTDHISLSVILYDGNGSYLESVYEDVWDDSSLTLQGSYPAALSGGCICASFEADNDSYYGLTYCF